MRNSLVLLILLFVSFSPFTFALEQDPPDGLEDLLAGMVESGYNTTYHTRGWSATYSLPQSQYSIDEADFYDNSIEFAEAGFYVVGLENLLNPQYAGLDLNASIPQSITQAATNVLPWVWTPANVSFGVHHKGTLPNQGITNVLTQVNGINGASNVCVEEESVAYNTWGVPKDTINKQTVSLLSSLAGTGNLFLIAAQYEASSAQKEKYMTIAKGIGDMLLTALVTPEGEAFGVHPEQLVDTYGNTMPVGLMPQQFIIAPDSMDTSACTDGGTIKLQENRKTYIAQTVLFWERLTQETGETQYAQAANIARDGILALQECDGSYKDYTRWEGPGVNPNTCTPDDGSPSYEAYAPNVAVSETKGFLTDMGVILYLLQKADPGVYNSNENYKTAVHYLLELEETDQGSGMNKNGDPVKYASYALDTENRPFAQIMMANVFLRASCIEENDSIEGRLQTQAYALIQKADTLVPSELDSKMSNAISPDPGSNILAVSAAADSWKIIEEGCQECTDEDGDGYVDGVCAGNMVKYDCNDSDASIHPGASETCDLIDNDCDGTIDNGFDEDGDGVTTCALEVDCNDDADDVYPGAIEKEDGADNDCNGKIDDGGINIQLLNDQNAGVGGIDIVLVDYGSVCANSFASLTGFIEEIKKQCSLIGECTTNEEGKCTIEVEYDGKFQALANIPDDGQASDPIEYKAGQNLPLLFQTEGTGINEDTNAGGKPNPFTSNPYFLAGFLLVGIIVGGIVLFYLVQTGRLKPAMGTRPGKTPAQPGLSPSKPEQAASTPRPPTPTGLSKKTFQLPKLKLPALPKAPPREPKKEGSMLYSPKMKVNALAEKIIKSPLPGSKFEERIKKPTNFPKKEETKKRKIWKDD